MAKHTEIPLYKPIKSSSIWPYGSTKSLSVTFKSGEMNRRRSYLNKRTLTFILTTEHSRTCSYDLIMQEIKFVEGTAVEQDKWQH